MAGSYPNQINPGAFVPTTNVWDVNQIYTTEVNSPAFKELLVRLYQNINNIAINLNLKDTGYYTLDEFLNSQLYFPNPALNSTTSQSPEFRQVFRKIIDFGALPDTTFKPMPHGLTITNNFSFTRIYATASDPVGLNYIPIPYASASGTENIELSVNATDVIITTASDRTAFTKTYVVLEYIKQ